MLLFTENETNAQRLYGVPNATPYVKDAFHEYVVQNNTKGRSESRAAPGHESERVGYTRQIPAGPGSVVIRLRLRKVGDAAGEITPSRAGFTKGPTSFDAVFAAAQAARRCVLCRIARRVSVRAGRGEAQQPQRLEDMRRSAAAGAGRDALEQAVLSLQCRKNG